MSPANPEGPKDSFGGSLRERRRAIDQAEEVLGVSERRACRLAAQARSTQRWVPVVREDEEPLTQEIVRLACQYGRYGYRQITNMLRNEGWRVNPPAMRSGGS